VVGDGDLLRATAESLDAARDGLARIYAARTGLDITQIVDMMHAETYLSAADALRLGFVDEIVPAKARPKDLASLKIEWLKSPPQALKEAVLLARAKVKMDPEILEALGLSADATSEDVMAAINALKDSVKAEEEEAPAEEEKPAEETEAKAEEDEPKEEDDEMAALAKLPAKMQAKYLALKTREDARVESEINDLLAKVPTNLHAWARKQSVETLREYVSSVGETIVVAKAPKAKAQVEMFSEDTATALARALGKPVAHAREILGVK
jgi:enoyl-CoA hydratase/carnithine racemase